MYGGGNKNSNSNNKPSNENYSDTSVPNLKSKKPWHRSDKTLKTKTLQNNREATLDFDSDNGSFNSSRPSFEANADKSNSVPFTRPPNNFGKPVDVGSGSSGIGDSSIGGRASKSQINKSVGSDIRDMSFSDEKSIEDYVDELNSKVGDMSLDSNVTHHSVNGGKKVWERTQRNKVKEPEKIQNVERKPLKLKPDNATTGLVMNVVKLEDTPPSSKLDYDSPATKNTAGGIKTIHKKQSNTVRIQTPGQNGSTTSLESGSTIDAIAVNKDFKTLSSNQDGNTAPKVQHNPRLHSSKSAPVPRGFVIPKMPLGMRRQNRTKQANNSTTVVSQDNNVPNFKKFDPLEPVNPSQWNTNPDPTFKFGMPSSTEASAFNGFGPGGRTGMGVLSKKFGASSDGQDPYAYGVSSLSSDNTPNFSSPPTAATVTQSFQELFDSLDTVEDENKGADSNSGKVEGLNVTLMAHQIQGLNFMKSREAKKVKSKGGLLCDDMGLGKTIQSIALILSNPYNSEECKEVSNQIRGTLVVAPLALVHQWAGEIREKAPKLKVMVHHGAKREKTASEFPSYDVIVTTFQVVASEWPSGPLFAKTWWRVIVDEAHTIKNHKTKSAQACYGLKGGRRWCLTGTPIQNGIDELQSLIQFLNIGPYNDRNVWKEQITLYINRPGGVATRRLRAVLAAIMLRRTKDVLKKAGGDSSFKMKGRKVHRVVVHFSPKEQEVYRSYQENAIGHLGNPTAGKSQYLSAYVLLLRLRQICDHFSLADNRLLDLDVDALGTKDSRPDDGVGDEVDNGDDSLADILGNLSIMEDDEKSVSSRSILESPSSKMKALLEILQQDPKRKTIVFSVFTSFLDILEPMLKSHGMKYVRYDGSMKSEMREKALNNLREDEEVTVLLCSLKAGSLGLNLTCASRVVLMDPWWNPMVSEQAIDRVHRIGQTRDVDVYEMMVEESVEENIMRLQDKKRQIAKQVIENGGRGAAKLNKNKLSMEELLALFH